MEKIFNKFRTKDVSHGAKVLTAATAVRWVGWGIAENLLPVFIFSFSANYAQAGLLKSSYDLAMILFLPIVGMLADRFRASTLVLVGYVIYVIVGSSYLLAGLSGLVIFIIIARFSNGIAYGLDAVGRETYYRRSNLPKKLATVFGYSDSISNFWWIVASLFGIILVRRFPIHWLLFMVVPAVMVSFAIVWIWRKRSEKVSLPKHKVKVNYREVLKEFGTWNYQLRLIMVLNFFLYASWAIITFFLPIEIYTKGAGYATVILFGIAATVPTLLGVYWGKFFDKRGPRIFVYGLLLYGIFMILLSASAAYALAITAAFVVGVIQEFVYVGKEELVTVYADPEHFGRVDGMMRMVMNMGSLAGPLIAGIVIDSTGGEKAVYLGLALCMLVLALGFALEGRRLHLKKIRAAEIPVPPEGAENH